MVMQIRRIIDALHQDDVAILLVEQNVSMTLEASQRVYIMEKGLSTFPSSSGSAATLMAIRRASSFVSTFACRASASLSRE
jgi:ABC-type branched-subunit amino acid transport system ATPase component